MSNEITSLWFCNWLCKFSILSKWSWVLCNNKSWKRIEIKSTFNLYFEITFIFLWISFLFNVSNYYSRLLIVPVFLSLIAEQKFVFYLLKLSFKNNPKMVLHFIFTSQNLSLYGTEWKLRKSNGVFVMTDDKNNDMLY